MFDEVGARNAYLAVYLQMDDSYKITTRQVKTIAMVFSDQGGFMTVVTLITLIIVQQVQSSIYFQALIRHNYLV